MSAPALAVPSQGERPRRRRATHVAEPSRHSMLAVSGRSGASSRCEHAEDTAWSDDGGLVAEPRSVAEPMDLGGLHRLADAGAHLVGVHHRRKRDLRVQAHKERLRRRRYPA
jgi:hypothetical protein